MAEDKDEWKDHAACKGMPTYYWFPNTKDPADYKVARAICQSCPVKDACLEAAMIEETYQGSFYRTGMRGGTTPSERIRMARRQKKQQTVVNIVRFRARRQK